MNSNCVCPEVCYQIRQRHAVPVLKQMQNWKNKSLLRVPPETLIGKAINYLHNHWQYLSEYVKDGNYLIDKNAAGRAIRPLTIGRKNWLFSKSQAGANASANLYSLTETVKLNGLNV